MDVARAAPAWARWARSAVGSSVAPAVADGVSTTAIDGVGERLGDGPEISGCQIAMRIAPITATPSRTHSGFPRRPGGGAGGPASPGGGPSGGTAGGVDGDVVGSAGGVGPSAVGGVGILTVGISSAISAQSLRGRPANAGDARRRQRRRWCVDAPWCRSLAESGVTRSAIGWQTFDGSAPGIAGAREVRAHRGPPDPAPSPGRTVRGRLAVRSSLDPAMSR